ncbi:MAG: HPr kinase/phosphorylase [Bradymonadaceae bacterium]
MFVHRAFGRLVTCDRGLAFESADAPDQTPEVAIRCDPSLELSLAEPIHVVEDYPGGPILRIYRNGDRIEIDYDGRLFAWTPGHGEVGYRGGEGERRSDWDLVIERVILPLYVLTSEADILAVHGSAAEIGGKAWVFIGESGAGKSTTAYELISAGGHLVADDMTLIDARAKIVLPGAPSLRLWKGKGEVRGAVDDRLVSDLTTKRWFRLQDNLATSRVVPLGGLIWLDPTDDAAHDGRFTRGRGQEGLADLLRQSFDFTNPPREWMIRRLGNARTVFADSPLIRYQYVRSPDGRPTHVERLRQWLLEASADVVVQE